MVHGDAHIGNAYVEPDGRVGFVDWQTVAVGPWVHDVNYFLVSALDVPDRRAHERGLLGHYLKALATFGVSAPGLDGRGTTTADPEDAVRDLNTATRITTLTYNQDGIVHEAFDDAVAETVEVISRSDVPLDINWEQVPEFGDWSRVARWSRESS